MNICSASSVVSRYHFLIKGTRASWEKKNDFSRKRPILGLVMEVYLNTKIIWEKSFFEQLSFKIGKPGKVESSLTVSWF